MKASSWFSKMIGTSLHLDGLECVLVMQLKDLYSAEDQLIEALPKMADAANSPKLRRALLDHLEETRRQKQRLESAFRMLGKEVESETCEAMQGLIAEGDEVAALEGDPAAKDAALIAAAQRVEHYEMAGYGCARTFARQLGHEDVAALLQESLDEEGDADKLLSGIAETFINVSAAQS
jgi:ferritin-like metal-binding protein YciE